MNQTPTSQPRTGQDRRRSPTGFWAMFRLRGRRERNRRQEEHRQSYYVERFGPITFVFLVGLLLLTIADGLFTVRLLGTEVEEANPLMRYLLGKSHRAFFVGKYALTAAGVCVLLVFKNFYLFRTRFRVGYLIPIFFTLYVVLIGYEWWMLSHSPQ